MRRPGPIWRRGFTRPPARWRRCSATRARARPTCLPGVLTALHEGVPVLAITSQHRMGVVYPSTPATFQGQDQLDLFRPVVKWGAPIFEWSRIPEVTRMAFREMFNGRPGPVHIELPAPILYETGDDAGAQLFPPSASRGSGPQPSDAH